MFEQQVELERRQGIRGPFTRFFGPLTSIEEARLALRDAATAALCAVAGWSLISLHVGPAVLVLSAFVAAPAVILFFRPSRIAAGSLAVLGLALLLFAALSLGGRAILAWPPVLLGGIAFLAGWRARRAMAVIRPNYLEAYHARQAQPDESPEQPEQGTNDRAHR